MEADGVRQPCRVVRLEWDRGHEELEAIIRAESDAGVVLTMVEDLVASSGLQWISGPELLDVDDLDEDHPSVRLAGLRCQRSEVWDSALTDAHTLLRYLANEGCLVFVKQRRTGSQEGRVGRIIRIDDEEVAFDEVDTKARWTGETFECEVADLISTTWGNDYRNYSPVG